jgi:hydroxyacylglutathione hydrolase
MPLEIVAFAGGPVDTNAYLVADAATGDALVVDAPHDTAQTIVDEAARRGWTIRRIVITHAHWDHIADAHALRTLTGAPLAAHPLAVQRLADPSSPFGELPVPVPPVETDETLSDGDTVTLGESDFAVLHLPGHDPAHIALSNTDDQVLLSGDVLFPAGHGRTDLPGSDQEVMNETLRRLVAELPPETNVLPGHGAPTTIGGETPWIRLLRQD